jgi:hypothetical protein
VRFDYIEPDTFTRVRRTANAKGRVLAEGDAYAPWSLWNDPSAGGRLDHCVCRRLPASVKRRLPLSRPQFWPPTHTIHNPGCCRVGVTRPTLRHSAVDRFITRSVTMSPAHVSRASYRRLSVLSEGDPNPLSCPPCGWGVAAVAAKCIIHSLNKFPLI